MDFLIQAKWPDFCAKNTLSSSKWKGHLMEMVLKCQRAPGRQRTHDFGERVWNLSPPLSLQAPAAVPILGHLHQPQGPLFVAMDCRVAAQGARRGWNLRTNVRKWLTWSLTLPKEGWREQGPICWVTCIFVYKIVIVVNWKLFIKHRIIWLYVKCIILIWSIFFNSKKSAGNFFYYYYYY